MYNASRAFHAAALADSAKPRAMLEFANSDLMFTNEDIKGDGLRVIETINPDTDLAIGAATSAELTGTIHNEHGLLNGFGYGLCTAKLGALTETVNDAAPTGCTAWTVLRYNDASPVTFAGYAAEPYLTANGDTPSVQPPFPVHALFLKGTTLYCVGANGELWGAVWADGQTWAQVSTMKWNDIAVQMWDSIQGTLIALEESEKWRDFVSTEWDDMAERIWSSFVHQIEVTPFMTRKFAGWAALHRGFAYNGYDTVYEFYPSGNVEKYEYVKLGVFNINTPAKRRTALVEIESNDGLAAFDVLADGYFSSLQYPTTLGAMFSGLCAFVGATAASTGFINSEKVYTEAPFDGKGLTAREVLKYIAEASGSVARMTRDGGVELAWFAAQNVTLNPVQYFDVDAAEYTVPKLDALQVLTSQSDVGVTIKASPSATVNNGYVITDNPYLYGADETAIRAKCSQIYQRLIAFPAYSPVTLSAVCDWSIQAGDIINVVIDGATYILPIFTQTIRFNGGVRVEYESTGSTGRKVADKARRDIYRQDKASHELTVDVNGLKERVTDAEGNILELDITAQGLRVDVNNNAGDIASLDVYARGITLSVSNGERSSGITLKSGDIQIASATIEFTGEVVFKSDLSTLGQTEINGGNVTTGIIKSSNYSYTSGDYSSAGMQIDLSNGLIRSKQFAIDANGNAKFAGALSAASGTFNGTLSAACITSGTLDVDRIGANSITADKLNASVVTTDALTAGQISIISKDSSNNKIDITSGKIDCYQGDKDVLISQGIVYVGAAGSGGMYGGQLESYKDGNVYGISLLASTTDRYTNPIVNIAANCASGTGAYGGMVRLMADNTSVVEVTKANGLRLSNLATSSLTNPTKPLCIDADGKVFKGSGGSGGVLTFNETPEVPGEYCLEIELIGRYGSQSFGTLNLETDGSVTWLEG